MTAVRPTPRGVRQDPLWIRVVLIGSTLVFALLMLVLPLAEVFAVALSRGLTPALRALTDQDTLAAVRLTLFTALIVVPANTLVGLLAGWVLTKHRLPAKTALITLIDLPLSVSPVVAGLSFVLVFGVSGWLGPVLKAMGAKIIFATPGVVLATLFVTFPFVAREVIPVMQDQGVHEEEAAASLGASWPQILFRVTLPNIRWALFYGVVLCASRAMGEFGAVSVVSGRIRGATDTLPLQVEALYNDYDVVGAFSAASLLCLLALATLVARSLMKRPAASAVGAQ